MFKKIMWATDGSESADRCLPLVESLAAESSAEVLIVHCEELTLPTKGGGAYSLHANENELLDKIRAQVEQLSGHEAPA